MSDINNCTFTGRLTRDAEMRKLENGTSVCRIGLAVNRRFKDKDREETVFIDGTIFGPMAEALGPHLHKGKKIGVTGRLTQRKWAGEDGIQRTFTGLTVHDLDLGEKSNGHDSGPTKANAEDDDVPF